MKTHDETALAESLIAALPLFRNLKADGALREVVDALAYRDVARGEAVIHQGDPADGMYLLLAGTMQVAVDGRVVARLGTGEAFGKMGLFGDGPRSADVVAVEPCFCAFLERAALDHALLRLPRLATNLMRALSQRVRTLNGMLLAARLAPPAAPVAPAPWGDTLTFLRAVPIFAAVTDERFLRRVAAALQPFDVPAGGRLFRQGEEGDRLFLLTKGTARVHMDTLDLARLGPSSPVGEMALLDAAPRSADVTAETACRFLALTQAQFFAAIAQSPAVARSILSVLSERIRQINHLVATTEPGQKAVPGFFPETAGPALWHRDPSTGHWRMPLPQAAAEEFAAVAETGALAGPDGFKQALQADATALLGALRARHAASPPGIIDEEAFARLEGLAGALVGRLRSPLAPRRNHAALAGKLYDTVLLAPRPVTLRMVLASPTALVEIADFIAVAELFRDAGVSVHPELIAVRWENLVSVRDLSPDVRRDSFQACIRGLREAMDGAGFAGAAIAAVDIEAAPSLEHVAAPRDFMAAILRVAAAASDMTTAEATLARNLLWITGFYARQHSLKALGEVQPLLDLAIRMSIEQRASGASAPGLALLLTSELNQRFIACYETALTIANISLKPREPSS